MIKIFLIFSRIYLASIGVTLLYAVLANATATETTLAGEIILDNPLSKVMAIIAGFCGIAIIVDEFSNQTARLYNN